MYMASIKRLRTSKRLANMQRAQRARIRDEDGDGDVDAEPVTAAELASLTEINETAHDVSSLMSTTENVQLEINHVERLLTDNHAAAASQHTEIMTAIRSLSASVSKITSRLNEMDQRINSIDTRVTQNESELCDVKTSVETITSRIVRVEKNQKRSSDNTMKKINAIQKKLKSLNVPIEIDDEIKESDVVDSIIHDNCVTVKHFPMSNNYESDISAMIWTGLRSNIQPKYIRKIETFGNEVTLCVEFYSNDDKMEVLRMKQRLNNTNEYCRVYLVGHKSDAETRMEDNLRTLITNMPRGNMYNMSRDGILHYNARQSNRNNYRY